MKRGDIVTAAPPGEFSKPRPALVVQAFTGEYTERVTVALITSELVGLPGVRIPVDPTAANGLIKSSEIAVDNLQTFSIAKIGKVIGSLDTLTMAAVDSALRLHLNLI